MYLSRKKYIAPIADKVIVDNSDEVLTDMGLGTGSEMLSKDGAGIQLESKSSSFSSEIWDSEN